MAQALPNADRNYGWILVDNARGTRHLVYMPASAAPPGAQPKSEVNFTVHVTPRGATAIDISVEDSDREQSQPKVPAA